MQQPIKPLPVLRTALVILTQSILIIVGAKTVGAEKLINDETLYALTSTLFFIAGWAALLTIITTFVSMALNIKTSGLHPTTFVFLCITILAFSAPLIWAWTPH